MAIIRNQNKNGVKHTEYGIQKILVRHFMSGAKYMVPNMFYRLGEMDMFLLRRSGYAEEFEIKITTSDLKADFKKLGKHHWFKSHSENQYFYNHTGREMFPNRFSYVLGPDVSWVKDWFPAYAGLYVVQNDQLVCLTASKLIHRQKCNWHERVAGSCCHRLLRAYKLRN